LDTIDAGVADAGDGDLAESDLPSELVCISFCFFLNRIDFSNLLVLDPL
jgi:hypothetical protein